jgi:anaerobic ribonucleoside-triphosphate reductase
LVEAAEFIGIPINDNPEYAKYVQDVLGIIERYNRKYRSKGVMFNCEMIPAENVA